MSAHVISHDASAPRLPAFVAPRWLVAAFLLAVLFPFASPLPAATDTQPLAVALALLILLWERILPGKLQRTELFLLVSAGLALLFVSPFAGDNSDLEIGKYLALPAGLIVLVVARSKFAHLKFSFFQAVVVIYFVWTILLLLAPGTFLPVQGLFVRGLNVAAENPFAFRGVLTFATEPGLFGGLLVFFLIVAEHFLRTNAITLARYLVIVAMIGFMIVVSKSGAGYLYTLIYVGFLASRRLKLLIPLVCIAAFGLWMMADTVRALLAMASQMELGRGAQALLILIEGAPLDRSMVGRTESLWAGLQSLAVHPFGVGANNVNDALRAIVPNAALVSGLAWCFGAYGVFAVFLFAYIFLGVSKAPIVNKFFSLLYLCFGYSHAFPPAWVLLGMDQQKARLPKTPGAGSVEERRRPQR